MTLRTCLSRPRSLATTRMLSAALTALLLAALLLPLAPAAGAADDDTPDRLAGGGQIIDVVPDPEPTETPAAPIVLSDAIVDDSGGDEVPPTIVPDLVPDASASDVPINPDIVDAPLADSAEPAYVSIFKYRCPEEENVYSTDHDGLKTTCTEPMPNIEFAHTDGGGSEVKLTEIDGGLSFVQETAGTATLAETVPAVFDEPIVYCVKVGGPLEQPYDFYQTSDGTFSTELLAGDQLVCDWFNVPYAGPASNLFVTKYLCPEAAGAYDADWATLIQACPNGGGDWEFSVSDGAQYLETKVTVANGGLADFSVPTPGAYSIVESVPDGYGAPVVFCTVYTGVGNDPVNWVKQGVLDGSQIFHTLNEGEKLFCDWFNVPGAYEGGDEPSEDDGSILVRKFACDYGYDADSATYFDLASECQQPMDGVTFLLADGNGATWSGTTGDFATGSVEFANLPTPGAYVILEQVPVGYGEPVVYCKDPIDPNGAWEKSSVAEGNQILEVLEGGHVLMCDWFNVPSGGTVTVVKVHCETSFDPDTITIEELPLDCEQHLDGVPFWLTVQGLYEEVRVTGDGGQGDGLAIWDNVPAGYLVIDEEIPTGYGKPAVWCSPTGSYNDLVKMEVEVDAIWVDYDGGELICFWVNVPTEGTDVVVYKIACPEGYAAYQAEIVDLAVDCDYPQAGVTFTLTTDGYDEAKVTGEGNVEPGQAIFTSVPSGDVILTEAIPAGYLQPRAFCVDVVGEFGPSDFFEVPVYDGAIELPVVGSLVCIWVNIPSTDEGTIEVVKYWCDGDVYDEAACEIYAAGQEFTLYAPGGGDPVVFTTGPDGRYSAKAGAGPWILGEGDGGWCHAESNRAVQPQPLPNPGFDGTSLLVEVEPDQTTVIEVFNCDPLTQDDPGDSGDGDGSGSGTPTGGSYPVPVKALPNTGAGTSLVADGAVGMAAAMILAGVLLAIAGVAVQRRRAG